MYFALGSSMIASSMATMRSLRSRNSSRVCSPIPLIWSSIEYWIFSLKGRPPVFLSDRRSNWSRFSAWVELPTPTWVVRSRRDSTYRALCSWVAGRRYQGRICCSSLQHKWRVATPSLFPWGFWPSRRASRSSPALIGRILRAVPLVIEKTALPKK